MKDSTIRYLNDCYQRDNRNQNLWDIFKENQDFARLTTAEEEEEFFPSAGPSTIKLNRDYWERLHGKAETYRREKNLIFTSHYIIGMRETYQMGKKVNRFTCSPLFFFDLEMGQGKNHDTGEKEFFLQGDPASFSWNLPLLLLLTEDQKKAEIIQSEFRKKSDFRDPQTLLRLIEKHAPPQRLTLSPDRFSSKREASQLKRGNGGFTLVPNGAVLLVDRSLSSRGIIDELDRMEKFDRVSLPLRLLEQDQADFLPGKPADCRNVPGLLSESQQTIIEQSALQGLSVLVGPPGTGKSYTIAALALERFMQNETVLIVSKNESAVDVIAEKLTRTLGLSRSALFRAGVKDYHKKLRASLENIIGGSGLKPPEESLFGEVIRANKRVERKEKEFARKLEREKRLGQRLYSDNGKLGLGDFIRLRRIVGQHKKGRFLHRGLAEIQSLNEKKEDTLARHINNIFRKRIYQTLSTGRRELIRFKKALGSISSGRQADYFARTDFNVVLNALPVWLCSLDALHKVLPLKAELFDLVIIDEATQCDIASCLPALFRAKRALVVGDPKQLRHVSFLSREQQSLLAEKNGLSRVDFSYRDHSMIDLALDRVTSGEAIVTLDEHYRSKPEIIQFSNKHFYDSRLRIMTGKPSHLKDKAVELVPVEGRRENKVNREEAHRVLEKLKSLVREQSTIPQEHKLSLGVLSFFRDQAEYLQNRILEDFSLDEITGHRLRAGTPYAFQGEEKDIILISCALDGDSPSSAYTYLNRNDVFNVSVTRAREKQFLFLSAPSDSLPENNLLNHYVRYIRSTSTDYKVDLTHRNRIIQEFIGHMNRMGFEALTNYPVAGIDMDIILMKENLVMAVDLVGFPGEEGRPLPVDRYKIFSRAGLTIHPVEFTGWEYFRDEIKQNLLNKFEEVRKKSTMARLSLVDMSHHWIKLLGTNPLLAEQVKNIEISLIARKEEKAHEQLGLLIDQFLKVQWILKDKLNPNELSYSRYMNSSEQVLLEGIDNYSRMVDLKKSVVNSSGQPLEERQQEVHRLLSENEKAVKALQALALQWAKTRTERSLSSGRMEGALDDLEDLTGKVDLFGEPIGK
ncbi:MAG: AAA domain-containing protein [Spirochaetales bacterium]|nr:AAA domain-containing protein [Spirochaetales bacterium]